MYQVEVLDNRGERELTLEMDSFENVAGVLAAGIGIAADIEYEFGKKFIFETNLDVSELRLLNNVQNIEQYIDKIDDKWFGIWLKGTWKYRSSLFTYQTDDFLTGIVWICNHFDLDYRNYIQTLPFDNLGNTYTILGDPMPQTQIGESAPDLDDFEEDEAADENVIEPLARTDDIITFKDWNL